MDVNAAIKQNFVYTECYSEMSTDFIERSKCYLRCTVYSETFMFIDFSLFS